MQFSTVVYAGFAVLPLIAASPISSFQKRTPLATPADLEKTVSFFENIVQNAHTHGNITDSDSLPIADEGFNHIRDVISGRTPITGITIEEPELVKNLVFPRIWGPLCKIIDCGFSPSPFPPWPSCDPAICDPVQPEGGCQFGICGPDGEDGPIFPIDPVVDPIDPDFAIEELKNWASGKVPLKLLATPNFETEDLKQLVSGIGNLAVSWRYSFEQSAAFKNEVAVRSPSGDDGIFEGELTSGDVKEILEIILLVVSIAVLL